MSVTPTTLRFNFTAAALVSILGAAAAVAVSFGAHFTQDNIHSFLLVAGIVLGSIAAGGGAKEAAIIHLEVREPSWLHFTPAAFVSLVGGIAAFAVSCGLGLTQQNVDSIMTLVGLVAAGVTLGGAQISRAAVMARTHPRLRDA
jgi:hypothetical protein